MSTEFTAQGAIELTRYGAGSTFVQALVTRSQDDPLASFEDVHVEMDGHTLWLDVYGTSFSCYDRLRGALAKLARLAEAPFAVTGSAEGEDFTWYFGPSRRETARFEIATRSVMIADQLRQLTRRLRRNEDPCLTDLQQAIQECAERLQRALRPLHVSTRRDLR